MLGRLGGLPLQTPDEGRNAEVAREMMADGGWLVPTYDGVPYLDKPAFFFKAVAVSLSVLGVSEAAARLPSAVSGLLLLGLLFAFCCRVYDRETARLAVVVLATSPMVVGFGRFVIFDMMLALFVSAALLAAYLAEEAEGPARRRWYLLSAAAVGLATLVKGPVGFVVPLLVMLVVHRVGGKPGATRRMLSPLNGAVFLALVLPWFLGVAHAAPDFPYYGLVEETLHRYTTDAYKRSEPVYFYLPVLLGLFFPWSLLLPEAVVAAWRARAGWSRADRFLAVWAIVVVLFFSTSRSKMPGYVLTAVVALGILCARLLVSARANPGGRAARILLRAVVALAAVAAVAAGLVAVEALHPGALAAPLGIRHPALEAVRPFMPVAAASLAAVAAIGAAARWRRDGRAAFAAFVALPLLLLSVNFGALRGYAATRSALALAERLSALPAATEIACLRCFPHGLPFYLERPVTLLTDDGGELSSHYVTFALARGRRWPERIVPLAEARAWLRGRPGDVVVLARARPPLAELVAETGQVVEDQGGGWWAARPPAREMR